LKPSRVGVKGSYFFAWDPELRGFGVQVMASGLKSFVVQYRNAAGRSRRIVIGRYGLITVEESVAHSTMALAAGRTLFEQSQ
jgi:hypothetical protein